MSFALFFWISMNFDSFLNIFLQERHKSSQFHGAYYTGWWLKPPLKLSVTGGSSSNFHDWWLKMHHMPYVRNQQPDISNDIGPSRLLIAPATKLLQQFSIFLAAFLLVILFHFITCYPIFCLVIFPSMSIFLGDFLRSSKFPLFPRLHGFWEPLAADAGRTHHLAIEAGDLGRSISMDLTTKSWRMDHN